MSKLILLCAPSGTGKTSIARMLCATDSRFHHVQVLTTRSIRPNEEGRHEKIQVAHSSLLQMKDAGELVNYNEKDGVCYGIKRASIAKPLSEGIYPVLEWDINNMEHWDKCFPVFKVVLKPISEDKILQSLGDGRDPDGKRKNGVFNELALINSGKLQSDMVVSNYDAAIMDTVQKIRSRIFKHF